MPARILSTLAALLAALALAACASGPQANVSGTGTVQSIAEIQQPSQTGSWVGAIGGALVGGWLGSNVGGGTGQTVATVVGSMGGSVAGSAVGSKAATNTVWDVTVRFDDGIDRTVRTKQPPAFRNGDRVRVSGDVIVRI
ncbi:MAG: glycine zipper 2TM domain-containing protein [Burkholderiales bacterium]|jgi:outer membrane lipoprotein SlyB|nr:glycine zipper 2TM domain-containing protein [Burkholderiales bacterium]